MSAQRVAGASFNAIASSLQDKNVLTTGETVRKWCIRLGIETPEQS